MKTIFLTVTLCASVMAQTPPTKAPATPATKAPATKAPATSTSKTGAASTTKAPATKAPATKSAAGDLLKPATLNATAPATFKVQLVTTKGNIVIEVHRDWAPLGADRFYNLVRAGFFTDAYFFRVIPNFMCQFGVSSKPEVSAVWANNNLKDDPPKQSNKRGYVTYAKTGAPNSRSTQLFINFKDNDFLDAQGFAPFGEVVEGMDVAEKFNSEYNAQFGGDSGRLQGPIAQEGKAFVEKNYPKLDRILRASIVPAAGAAPATKGDAKSAPATKAPATGTKSGTSTTKAPATGTKSATPASKSSTTKTTPPDAKKQ